MRQTDVVVIGGGPAGLAAAIAAKKAGASVLLLEREERLGGILKQCIHDGFGIVRFGEKLSGPEYAERFTDEFYSEGLTALTQTFVTKIEKNQNGFALSAMNQQGIEHLQTKALIFATGCRERTARQVFIYGTRPAGVFTAGTAQHFINILGQMPSKKCVILGSGDIGLIMARRLTLEGAEVLGVYEAKPTPSGLTRNLQQCLEDFNIPLHLSKTVTQVFGTDRLTAVEVCEVDKNMCPIAGTEEKIECDALILSVGLIPENELAEQLCVKMDPSTKGPVCDDDLMTNVPGVFCCGNALYVNDLVDYVSESGETAGKAAAAYALTGGKRQLIDLKKGAELLYLVPQQFNLQSEKKVATLYFRSRRVLGPCTLLIKIEGQEILRKKYSAMRPPEMERLVVDFSKVSLSAHSVVTVEIAEETK